MMTHRSTLLTSIHPPTHGEPHHVYSEVIVIRLSDTVNQINVAGQIATTPDGETPNTLAEQIDVALAKVSVCLDAAGATVHDLSRIIYYFTEEAWAQDGALDLVVDKAAAWLQGHRPASTLLVVKALQSPELMCEFEAQAVVLAKNA